MLGAADGVENADGGWELTLTADATTGEAMRDTFGVVAHIGGVSQPYADAGLFESEPVTFTTTE